MSHKKRWKGVQTQDSDSAHIFVTFMLCPIFFYLHLLTHGRGEGWIWSTMIAQVLLAGVDKQSSPNREVDTLEARPAHSRWPRKVIRKKESCSQRELSIQIWFVLSRWSAQRLQPPFLSAAFHSVPPVSTEKSLELTTAPSQSALHPSKNLILKPGGRKRAGDVWPQERSPSPWHPGILGEKERDYVYIRGRGWPRHFPYFPKTLFPEQTLFPHCFRAKRRPTVRLQQLSLLFLW